MITIFILISSFHHKYNKLEHVCQSLPSSLPWVAWTASPEAASPCQQPQQGSAWPREEGGWGSPSEQVGTWALGAPPFWGMPPHLLLCCFKGKGICTPSKPLIYLWSRRMKGRHKECSKKVRLRGCNCFLPSRVYRQPATGIISIQRWCKGNHGRYSRSRTLKLTFQVSHLGEETRTLFSLLCWWNNCLAHHTAARHITESNFDRMGSSLTELSGNKQLSLEAA